MVSFESVKKFVYDRRRGLLSATAFVGGAYLAGHYALRRLEEVRERLIEEKTAKENLRNRFNRNQEDCIFTSQVLVPAFGNQILTELDVEALTLKIQRYGKPRDERRESMSVASEVSDVQQQPPHQHQLEVSGESTSTNLIPSITTQDTTSSTSEVVPGHAQETTQQSWVDEFTASQVIAPENLPLPPPTPPEGSPHSSWNGLALSEAAPTVETASEQGDLHGSVYTYSSHAEDSESILNGAHDIPPLEFPLPSPPSPEPRKTKAELWKDLRTMTFTRTFTLIYTLTLLTLQTHIQLNILASFKYVQSIIEMEESQKARESTWWGTFFNGEPDKSKDWDEFIGEVTEQKYLTMSWWLLNVGRKAVMEEVERAVKEVFDRVPLKSELTADDLRTYINEVRVKVDFAGARTTHTKLDDELDELERERLQGAPPEPSPSSSASHKQRRTEFLPMLLPLTPAAEQQTLLAGGLSPDLILSSTLTDTRAFSSLMTQTRTFITSKDFQVVLDRALDFSVGLFLDAVCGEVYGEGRLSLENLVGREGEEAVDGEVLGEKKIRLAALLPAVARWSHTVVNGMPNEVIEGISHLPEVSAFSAIVFASYEDRLQAAAEESTR